MLGGLASRALADAPLSSLRPKPRAGDYVKPAPPSADELVAKANLTGKVCFAVADARTGELLETRNPLLAQPPASVTKSITALYAMDRLGPDYRFRTRLVADGPLAGGRLKGNLLLVGGGDPTLDTDALGDMARRLKEIGVREITGKFLVHSGALPAIGSIDPEQPDQAGYNPSVSGLNLNYNRVYFEWKRQPGGYQVTLDARARKFRPQVAVTEMRVVDRSLPVYTYTDRGGTDSWTVARGALGNAGGRWLPVRKPELYAAEVFQTLARAHGIVLPAASVTKADPGGTVLVEHASDTLRDVLSGMLRFSTNLTAEVVGLAATKAKGNDARTLKASAAAMNDWAREALGAQKAKFVDHSGLGGDSRLAPVDTVKALVSVHGSQVLKDILKDIPMRNEKGEILRNHPIKIRAKTGTLDFASALAGYISAPNGRELAFAIFAADVPRRDRIDRTSGQSPQGGRAWTRRARQLHLQLIERWGTV